MGPAAGHSTPQRSQRQSGEQGHHGHQGKVMVSASPGQQRSQIGKGQLPPSRSQQPVGKQGGAPHQQGRRREAQNRRADQLATGMPPGAAPDPRQQKARHQRQQIAPKLCRNGGIGGLDIPVRCRSSRL